MTGINEDGRAVMYEDYPKWLNHPQASGNRLAPVLVHDEAQEAEWTAKGWVAPKTDAHAFQMAAATSKIDDAVRRLESDIDRRFKDAVAKLFVDVTRIIRDEVESVLDERADGGLPRSSDEQTCHLPCDDEPMVRDGSGKPSRARIVDDFDYLHERLKARMKAPLHDFISATRKPFDAIWSLSDET